MSGTTYITGDTHGNFSRIQLFCEKMETTKDDTLIILGDSGLNYFTDFRNEGYKKTASRLPIKLFCIHGNHEERAENIKSYRESTFWCGKVLIEDKYPDLIFAQDAEVYTIPTICGDEEAIVIGGAYSVDKYYRLSKGLHWYESEQPSDKIKDKVKEVLNSRNYNIDLILSHTAPLRFEPTEWFIKGLDESSVDKSTEIFLDEIYKSLNHFDKWYCGHYHGDKQIDKLQFMYNVISIL